MSVKSDRLVRTWPNDPTMLRISVGLEDPEDLWADLAGLFGELERHGAGKRASQVNL